MNDNKDIKNLSLEMESVKKHRNSRKIKKILISVAIAIVIIIGLLMTVLAIYGIVFFPIGKFK